jgi:DNA polymerase-1
MFLVDGSNLAFRVHFALPPRHTSALFPTRVLYGFTLMLQKMMRTYQPDYCVVSFDIGKTFRHEMYPDYKGHRPDMPEDLRQQWSLLPDLVRAFGFPCINMAGFEADDVLCSLAVQFASEDVHAYLLTSDKDFAQVVGPNISILDEGKGGRTLGVPEVQDKMGVLPEQVVDLLALMGDSSDNIPGVPGVGPKTAGTLLGQYGDLESVLSAAADGLVKGKRGANLVEFAENARLSKRLAEIRTDLELGVDLNGLAPAGLQVDDLRPMFESWEFGAVARKLLPAQETAEDVTYRAITTQEEVDALWPSLEAANPLGVALRTHGKEPERAAWIGVSFSCDDHHVYLPLEPALGVAYEVEAVRERVLKLLADDSVPKVFHGCKLQLRTLMAQGGTLAGLQGDARLLDYVLSAHRRTHSLEDLAQRHLGRQLAFVPQQDPMRLEDVASYAAEPAYLARTLHERLKPRLSEEINSVYREIELPLLPVLADVESRGILLDQEALSAVRDDIRIRCDESERACHDLAGRPFKVGSPKEVGALLFEELGLPAGKKTRSGGWSTDSSVLEGLADQHELPQHILSYRRLKKLEGTYLAKLPQHVCADGRIRTTLHQAIVATGRLSSSDPNLQNIPIRTFEGRRIREAFVAPAGSVLMSFDYSQVELRILAHCCEADALIESFQRGEDIHTRTASEVWGVPMDGIDVGLRSAAKAINFGLLYGMSAFRLARDLGISRGDAQAHMDAYFGRMPRVPGWIEETKERCRAQGYAETLYGRRRLIPEIRSKNFNERSGAEREAVNTVIQGTAADIIKIAMVRVYNALLAANCEAKIVLQVHDELLLEVPEIEVDRVTEIVESEMMGAASLAVPLRVNYASGTNWNQAHG